MTSNETAIELQCRKDGLDIVEYPLYRTVQGLYTILSLASVPLLLYIQIKYIFISTFHWNIKIILLLYYSLALLHAVAYCGNQVYSITSSIVNKPCDFFPPTYVYIALHLNTTLSSYGMGGANCKVGLTLRGPKFNVVLMHAWMPMHFGEIAGLHNSWEYGNIIVPQRSDKSQSLIAICCERTVATIRSSKYERNGIALGLLLLALVVIGIFAAASYVYEFEDFNVKVWSVFAIPPDSIVRYNRYMMLNTTIGFICIVTFYVSSRINKRRCSIRSSTLTSRYQTRENMITTQFATHIATLQMIFFVLYGCGGVLARVFGYQLFRNKKLYICLRQMFYAIPIFTVVLPIYSIYRLKHYRLHRDSNIRSIVKMESRGVAGSRNYEHIISKSWQLSRQQ